MELCISGFVFFVFMYYGMLCIFVSVGISQVHATRHLTWKQVTDHAVNIVKKAAHKILFHVTDLREQLTWGQERSKCNACMYLFTEGILVIFQGKILWNLGLNWMNSTDSLT